MVVAQRLLFVLPLLLLVAGILPTPPVQSAAPWDSLPYPDLPISIPVHPTPAECRRDVGYEFALLIDVSTSMTMDLGADGTRISAAKDASSRFLADLTPYDFSSAFTSKAESTRVAAASPSHGATSAAIPGSAVPDGWSTHRATISAAAAELDSTGYSRASRNIIAISDTSDPEAVAPAEAVRGSGINIFYIELGAGSPDDAAKRTASHPTYPWVSGPTSLEDLRATIDDIRATIPPPPPEPAKSAPTAPRNLVAAQTGTTTATLSWSRPVSDGGCPISYYDVYRRVLPSGAFRHIGWTSGTTTRFDDNVGVPGICRSFQYYVTATNYQGTSGPSNKATLLYSTPACSLPPPPPPPPTPLGGCLRYVYHIVGQSEWTSNPSYEVTDRPEDRDPSYDWSGTNEYVQAITDIPLSVVSHDVPHGIYGTPDWSYINWNTHHWVAHWGDSARVFISHEAPRLPRKWYLDDGNLHPADFPGSNVGIGIQVAVDDYLATRATRPDSLIDDVTLLIRTTGQDADVHSSEILAQAARAKALGMRIVVVHVASGGPDIHDFYENESLLKAIAQDGARSWYYSREHTYPPGTTYWPGDRGSADWPEWKDLDAAWRAQLWGAC